MTAYELFQSTYYHYIVSTISKTVTIKEEDMQQAFNETLDVYTVEGACSNGIRLVFGNPPDKTRVDLESVELQEGYWLCHYAKLDKVWEFSHYIFENEAIDGLNEWNTYLPRVQDWFIIMQVGDLFTDH